MNDDLRPDPDELLKKIQQAEEHANFGKLKIFFGMCAGVGKTYAMLSAGQERKREGCNLLVGLAETHGRKETEALLEGLPILQLKEIKYKDLTFKELNLDGILQAKPELVLVDELAHTNVPGSRHEKRWQDVLEILNNGIDVYTTLNVQHLESYKDIVEGITKIAIRETVPDLVIHRASEIELVDLTPKNLLVRLSEGKVYLGDQSKLALENFFKEDRLTALRELSLRITAEKVERDLQKLALTQDVSSWRVHERLLVGVSANPNAQNIIRVASRLAASLDVTWIVLHVATDKVLDDEEKAILSKNLQLATELGAEVLTTADTDVAHAIERVARQKNITQILIGRKNYRTWKELFGGTILGHLSRECRDIDIHVVRQEDVATQPKKRKWFDIRFTSQASSYLGTFIFMGLLTLLGSLLVPYCGHQIVGFIYLFGILILSLFVGKGPIFFAAIFGAFIWDFFFIPPEGIGIAKVEDISFLVAYFVLAIANGVLITRIRDREKMLRLREENNQLLYEIEHELAKHPTLDELYDSINVRMHLLLDGACKILIKDPKSGDLLELNSTVIADEKEKAVAKWVLENEKIAGYSTDTLSSVEGIYFPMKGYKGMVGVFEFIPEKAKTVSHEEKDLLFTIAHRLAVYLERSLSDK
jgi:two-component system, OmpR family, sensor histidine kinase KdpD